jgi:hypothetical protein
MEDIINDNTNCYDCGKEIEIKDSEILDGKLLSYEVEGKHDWPEKITIIKCDECFEKDPSLSNYKECEVYSRIVGYLRPVQQWNPGKVEEYNGRKNFKS